MARRATTVFVTLAAAEPAKQDATPKQEQPAKSKKADKSAPSKAEKKAATDAIAASYEAIPLAERVSIQSDLIWTGDYNGMLNGEFGEREEGFENEGPAFERGEE